MDLPVVREAIQCYEKATGACLNTIKSKALAVEGWSTTTNALNIQYHAEFKILGVSFTSTIAQLINKSWAIITRKVRAQTRDTYGRDLCLSHLIRYVQAYILAKIWHTTQLFSTPTMCKRQWATAIAWYIWKGTTFRVPISTLQRPKREGDWGLIDIEAECRALLDGRVLLQGMKKGSATATWLQEWNLSGPRVNTPHVGRIPTELVLLYRYALDMAYIVPQGMTKRSGLSKGFYIVPCI
jgi:hypothetical protein